jgi:3'-5' exonuclease
VQLYHYAFGSRDSNTRQAVVSIFCDGLEQCPGMIESEQGASVHTDDNTLEEGKKYRVPLHTFSPWFCQSHHSWNQDLPSCDREKRLSVAIQKWRNDALYPVQYLVKHPEQCIRSTGVDDIDMEFWRDADLSNATVASAMRSQSGDQDVQWTLVDSVEGMKEMLDALERRRPTEIALDVEAYNPSKQTQVTCLLQLAVSSWPMSSMPEMFMDGSSSNNNNNNLYKSITGADGGCGCYHEYVIDVLAPGVWDMVGGLALYMADPSIVKIGHSLGGIDVRCLHRDFGIVVVNAWDTYEAAKVLKLPQLSLAALCQYYRLPAYDEYQALKDVYQTCDWRLRPLTGKMIQYGRYDVQYLMRLRVLQMRDLCMPREVMEKSRLVPFAGSDSWRARQVTAVQLALSLHKLGSTSDDIDDDDDKGNDSGEGEGEGDSEDYKVNYGGNITADTDRDKDDEAMEESETGVETDYTEGGEESCENEDGDVDMDVSVEGVCNDGKSNNDINRNNVSVDKNDRDEAAKAVLEVYEEAIERVESGISTEDSTDAQESAPKNTVNALTSFDESIHTIGGIFNSAVTSFADDNGDDDGGGVGFDAEDQAFYTPRESRSLNASSLVCREETDECEAHLSVLSAEMMRKESGLLTVLKKSQQRCLDVWSGTDDSPWRCPLFQSFVRRGRRREVDWTPVNARLYEDLMLWRRQVAQQLVCLPGLVAPLELLVVVAYQRPTSVEALRRARYDWPEVLEVYPEFVDALLQRVDQFLQHNPGMKASQEEVLYYGVSSGASNASGGNERKRKFPWMLAIGAGVATVAIIALRRKRRR